MLLTVAVTFLFSSSSSGFSASASLFEGHQLSLDYLVRNLLKLYVDIEFTGSHTQVIILVEQYDLLLWTYSSLCFSICPICSRPCVLLNIILVQFFDKFTIRHNIAELLEYLWDVPSHRNAWRQVR